MARTPTFFKVLMDDFEDRLGIPAAFIRYIIHELHEVAVILGPTGESWFVKIRGEIPDLYFGEGWERFVCHYRLVLGCFVIFSYLGGMTFSVVVYDRSCCNRIYSHICTEEGDGTNVVRNTIKEEAKSQESITKSIDDEQLGDLLNEEQLGDLLNEEETEMLNATHVDSPKMNKIIRTSQCPENTSIHEKKKKKKKNKKKKNKMKEEEVIGKNNDTEGSDTDFCKEMSICHTTPKFRTVLKPRNLDGNYYLYVPVEFKACAAISEKEEVILRDPGGNTWLVQLCHSTKNRTLLSKGWKDFCLHNELKPGDDCEFFLASDSGEDNIILQVHIYRRPEHEREAAIQVVKTCGVELSGIPRFWITVSEYNLRFPLQIPNAYTTATKFYKKGWVTLRDENGCSFLVEISYCTRDRCFLKLGWHVFASHNTLKPGDICEFRPSSDLEEDDIFLVTILRC